MSTTRYDNEIQPAEPHPPKADDVLHHEDPLKPADPPVDGDLGAGWLANYGGNRPELTEKHSEQVRKRVSDVCPILIVSVGPIAEGTD